MPRSQTPVVSWTLALAHPGLLPSGHCTPSAFPSLQREDYPVDHDSTIFRGSITRPASSFLPASYAHDWGCTWSSLLTCWRGVGQVGCAPLGAHPLGNSNQFHRIAPNPMVSGLSWHEQCFVRRGMWQGHRTFLPLYGPGVPTTPSDSRWGCLLNRQLLSRSHPPEKRLAPCGLPCTARWSRGARCRAPPHSLTSAHDTLCWSLCPEMTPPHDAAVSLHPVLLRARINSGVTSRTNIWLAVCISHAA